MRSDQFTAASRRLTGLSSEEQIREGVMLSAFLRLVDDPTTVLDERDIDNDGNRDEQVSAFADAWDRRSERIKHHVDEVSADLGGLIDQFLAGPMATFTEVARASYASCGMPICGDQLCEPIEV